MNATDQYLTSIGEAISNSFPERNKTTVLGAFEALFNKRDYPFEQIGVGRRFYANFSEKYGGGAPLPNALPWRHRDGSRSPGRACQLCRPSQRRFCCPPPESITGSRL